MVLNVDGLERHRRKWSLLGRAAYRVSEALSTIIPDAVVSDAVVIRDYYRNRYGFDSVFIPYGGDLPVPEGHAALARLGLESEKYVLYVSRLEPENNALEVVRAFRDVPGETRLVVVGDAPYAAGVHRPCPRGGRSARPVPRGHLRRGIPGAPRPCRGLRAGHGSGGTHPALVEALGYGRIVAYHASPENEEVAGGAALPFDVHQPGSLAGVLAGLLDDPGAASVWKERARQRVRERYQWKDVVDRYEQLLVKG